MATTTITIFHDTAMADETVVEKMRPDGIPQLGNPGDYTNGYSKEYATKMQNFFARVVSGSESANIISCVHSQTLPAFGNIAITNNGAIVDGDLIVIGSIYFEAVTVTPFFELQFEIGASAADTASNLADTIQSAIGAGYFAGAISVEYGGATEIDLTCLMGPVGTLIITATNSAGITCAAPTLELPVSTETVGHAYEAGYGRPSFTVSATGGTSQRGQAPAFTLPSGTYEASMSPLSWDGDDYDQAAFGSMVPGAYWAVATGGGGTWVGADDTTVAHVPDGQTLPEFDAILMTTGGNNVTMFLDSRYYGVNPRTAAGAQTTLINTLMIADAVVLQYKEAAWTSDPAGGVDYTWNGLTGFENAGAVTVTAGYTAPPTLVFVPTP